MDILNPETLLAQHFGGRIVAKQPGVPEIAWGKTIRTVYWDSFSWVVNLVDGIPFRLSDEPNLGLEPASVRPTLEAALQIASQAEERAHRAGLPRDHWPLKCDALANARGMLRPGGKRNQDAYWAGEVVYAAELRMAAAGA